MRSTLFAAATSCLCALVSACGAATPPPSVTVSSETAGRVEAVERAVFEELARSDRRLARRFGMRAHGVQLLFPENRAPAELAGLFDFEGRGQALLRAHRAMERDRQGLEGDPRWAALSLMIEEERARVAEERELPRGASAIVRTLALELPISDTRAEDVQAEDQALVAALDRLRAVVRDGSLGPMQLAELDDSLDLVEKRSAGLAGTPGAVARLRITLSSVRSAPKEVIEAWESTKKRIDAFAGTIPPDLVHTLETAHVTLAPRLGASLPRDEAARARLAPIATTMLLSSGEDCEDAGLAPAKAPIERRGLCALLRSLAKDEPAALLAADFAVEAARWALAIHQGRADVQTTFGSLKTAVPLDESDRAHAFRFALAHPAEAVILGWGAALVAQDPKKLAAAWMTAGPVRPGEARVTVLRSVM